MQSKNTKLICCLAGFAVLCTLTGCSNPYTVLKALSFEKDVTTKERYWGGYQPGAVYVLQEAVFIKPRIDWSERLVLTPPKKEYSSNGLLLYSAPDIIPRDMDGNRVLSGGLEIVEANTRLKLVKIIKHGAYTVGSSLCFLAEVLDGEHEEKVVDISDLSSYFQGNSNDPVLLEPDPVLIQPEATE